MKRKDAPSEKTYERICVYRNYPVKGSKAYAHAVNRKTGRLKSFYKKSHKRRSQVSKFKRLLVFGRHLPEVRRQYASLVKSDNDKDKLYGLVMLLMDRYGMRPGTLQHKRRTGVIGASTMDSAHVLIGKPRSGCVTFAFPGKMHAARMSKKKKKNRYGPLCEKDAVRALKKLYARKSGYAVSGRPLKMDFTDLLPKGTSAKDFRMWRANSLYLKHALQQRQQNPDFSPVEVSRAAVNRTARQLHHSDKACKQYYLDPYIMNLVKRNQIEEETSGGEKGEDRASASEALSPSEALLLKLLKEKYA